VGDRILDRPLAIPKQPSLDPDIPLLPHPLLLDSQLQVVLVGTFGLTIAQFQDHRL
jgi:hypothetical protein